MNAFKETQKLTQWWLWAIILGVAGMWLLGFVQQVVLGHPLGNNPASNTELLLAGIIPFGMIILFYVLTLKTEINDQQINVTYFPLWSTKVAWADVAKAEVITYGFVGYGIRLFTEYGTVYNTKGNVGLLVTKRNGGKILIGTQRASELKEVIEGIKCRE